MIVKNITLEQMIEILSPIGDILNTPETFDTATLARHFRRKYAYNEIFEPDYFGLEDLQLDVDFTVTKYMELLNSILVVTLTDFDPLLLTNIRTDSELETIKKIIDDFNSSKTNSLESTSTSTSNSTLESTVETDDHNISSSDAESKTNGTTDNTGTNTTATTGSQNGNVSGANITTNSKNTYDNNTLAITEQVNAQTSDVTDNSSISNTTDTLNTKVTTAGTDVQEASSTDDRTIKQGTETETSDVNTRQDESSLIESSVDIRNTDDTTNDVGVNIRAGFENINYYDALTTLYKVKEKNWYSTLLILIKENICSPWVDMSESDYETI